MQEYGFKTKCRAVFIFSLNIYTQYRTAVDKNFLSSIDSFAQDLLFEDPRNINDLDSITYLKYEKIVDEQNNIIDERYIPFEPDFALPSLINLLSEIKSLKDLSKLYDELGTDVVDKISKLAMKYLSYLDSFVDYIPKQKLLMKN